MDPATYIQVGDTVRVMFRSMELRGLEGTVLDIGPGAYGYRTFVVQKAGTDFGQAEAVGVLESQAVFSVRHGDCFVGVPLPLVIEEAEVKEARRLVNERKRIETKAPLFADQIAILPPDPDDMVQRFNTEACERLQRDHDKAVECNAVRAEVEALCSADDFDYLVWQRTRTYPLDSLFGLHFWRKQLTHIREHGTIERFIPPQPMDKALDLPWLKLDSIQTWKTAPGGPKQVKVMYIAPKTVMCKLVGDLSYDTHWLKVEDFEVTQ